MAGWPGWLRQVWWAVLLLAGTAGLVWRFDKITTAQPTAFDAALLAIVAGLAISPLFTEITILGLSLKRHLEAAKAEIVREVASLRTDVQVRNNVNVMTVLPPPPSDQEAKLLVPLLREQLRREAIIGQLAPAADTVPTLPPDAEFLIATRVEIERQVRGIYDLVANRPALEPRRAPLGVLRMAEELVRYEVIDKRWLEVLRIIMSICNLAAHGEPASEGQLALVKDAAPSLIANLKQVRARIA